MKQTQFKKILLSRFPNMENIFFFVKKAKYSEVLYVSRCVILFSRLYREKGIKKKISIQKER